MKQLIPVEDFDTKLGLLVLRTTWLAEALEIPEDALMEMIEGRMDEYEDYVSELGLDWLDVTSMSDSGDTLDLSLAGFEALLLVPLLGNPTLKHKYKQITNSFRSAHAELVAMGKTVNLATEGN